MSKNITTIEKSAIEYLCGLIRDISNVSEGIDDINLRSNGTFSSVKIDTLLNNLETNCNEYTDRLVANLSRLELKIVTDEADINKSNILYLHKPDGATSYNQYVVIEGNKVLLGTTDISMTDYYTIAQADAKFCLITDYNSLKTEYETHRDDVDIHTSATEKASYVKKTDITTTIDSSSTDTQVPSAKAIYNKSKNSITNLSRGTDIISYAETFGRLFITDIVRLRDSTSSPYGVGNNNNDFYYTIYNMDENRYKRIIAYDIRKNDMYMIMRNADGWGTWQRVCTTSIADVGKTDITSNVLNATVNSGGSIHYSIKNGICYVRISGIAVSEDSSNQKILSNGSLPIPDTELTNGHYPIVSPNSTNGLIVLTGGGGAIYHGSAMSIFTTISYPVKES